MDQNGTINFEEFMRLMSMHVTDRDNDEDLRNVFRVFDKVKIVFFKSIVMEIFALTLNLKGRKRVHNSSRIKTGYAKP